MNEEKWSFSLKDAMAGVHERGPSKLMAGLKFMVTPSTKPGFEDLKEMVEAAGGVCSLLGPINLLGGFGGLAVRAE